MPNLRRAMMAAAGATGAGDGSTGELWGWGQDGTGAIGAGIVDGYNQYSPVQITITTADWQTVDLDNFGLCKYGAADNAASAVNGDGELYTWGSGGGGRGGRGDTVNVCVPVQVGSLTDWAYCTGGYSQWAIKTDGTWWFIGGENSEGAAGQENTTDYSSPVQIGSETYWAKCAGNYKVAFAITNHGSSNDGQLWAVGSGSQGKLGIGSDTSISSPVQVGSLETWSQVIVGHAAVAGLRSDGALFTWGYNDNGQLGDGTTTERNSPVQIGTTEWAYASMGYKNNVWAVKTDGTLWAWGLNDFGHLGLGNTTNYSSPVQVGSLTDWKLTAGPVYAGIALKTDGTLWSCGRGSFGVLGHGNTTNLSSPAQIGSDTDWISIGNTQAWHIHGVKSA